MLVMLIPVMISGWGIFLNAFGICYMCLLPVFAHAYNYTDVLPTLCSLAAYDLSMKPVWIKLLAYGTNEAAFQAQKCMTEEEKQPFTEYGPGKSKGMGRKVLLRPDWEQVKVGIMEEIVRAKFTQHPELARLLIGTGDKILVEGNHWGDTCWGVDTRTGQGENHLGKILMIVRNELDGK